MRIKRNRQNHSTFSYTVLVIAAIALMILSAMAAVTVGSMNISIQDVYGVIGWELFHPKSLEQYASGSVRNIVWLIRFPRVLLAMAVGMGLSVAGVIMQAIVKNPLAEPYILGISSGASLGATAALCFGLGSFMGGSAVGTSAFVGAFVISLLVVAVSNIGGKANSVKLVLSGMAIGALCSAISNFMIYLANDSDTTQEVTFWMLGSFSGADWPETVVILLIVILGTVYFWLNSRPLNLMLLGDDVSITLGTHLNRYRYAYLLITSLMIGLCVYASGTISFVGLIVPHGVRMLTGTNHRRLIPLSALCGGIFLIWADVLCRVIIPDSEVPVGILVALIGAPVFIYMMIQKTYGFGGRD